MKKSIDVSLGFFTSLNIIYVSVSLIIFFLLGDKNGSQGDDWSFILIHLPFCFILAVGLLFILISSSTSLKMSQRNTQLFINPELYIGLLIFHVVDIMVLMSTSIPYMVALLSIVGWAIYEIFIFNAVLNTSRLGNNAPAG